VARGDIAFAAARLIDGGIAAETALARARPFRGLPGAEDAELWAAQPFELRPHYRDWLDREPMGPLPEPPDGDSDPGFHIRPDPGDDGDPGHRLPPLRRPGAGSPQEPDTALVDRSGRSFEDWFFRTGDASLARGLAPQDLRFESADDPDRRDDTEPLPDDPGEEQPDPGGCPDVLRPGWTCDGGGYWRPASLDHARPFAERTGALPESNSQAEEGEPPIPDTPAPPARER
jgi:hypothetical protein